MRPVRTATLHFHEAEEHSDDREEPNDESADDLVPAPGFLGSRRHGAVALLIDDIDLVPLAGNNELQGVVG